MRPARETIRKHETGAAFFVSTQTAGRKPFFRHERWARLMIATLAHYAEKDFKLHAYVIMPDHLHILITSFESLEKSVQLIKGGFSFRARRELDWKFDIWQPGFTDHRIRDEEDWKRHLEYVRANPIEAQLVENSVFYEFMGFPNIAIPQGLRPQSNKDGDVRAEARTLHLQPMPPKPTQAVEAGAMPGSGKSAGQAVELNPCGVRGTGFRPASPPMIGEMKGTGFSPRRVRPLGRTSEPANGGALAPEEQAR